VQQNMEMIVLFFSTCHSQRLIFLFGVQSVAVSMFPLQTGGAPSPDHLELLQWRDSEQHGTFDWFPSAEMRRVISREINRRKQVL